MQVKKEPYYPKTLLLKHVASLQGKPETATANLKPHDAAPPARSNCSPAVFGSVPQLAGIGTPANTSQRLH